MVKNAFTNASGIATIVFRMVSTVFGNYTVVAKTTVKGAPLQDSITFYVGWEVELQEVITCKENRGLWMPTTEFTKREHMIFLITIENNIPEVREVTISLLVYDEDDLLIAYALLQIAILNETQIALYLETPEWTRVGKAWVVVNAHTNLPWVDGRPYCPSIAASFTIKEG